MESDSTSVRLSPSQRAYRDDPLGFVARLEERAAHLFEHGYRVHPGEERHVFVVTNSTRKEEVGYLVRPRDGACTCPFYTWQASGEYLGEDGVLVPCKHLVGLSGLVKKTRHECYQQGRVKAFCALSIHWMKHLDTLRKERIRIAQATEDREVTRVAVRPPEPAQQSASGQPTTGFRSCGVGWQSSGKENGKWQR